MKILGFLKFLIIPLDNNVQGVYIFIIKETVMFNVLDNVNMYDMFTNQKVIADSLEYCYMNYIYLYKMGDFFIFRGVERDSDGYLDLGRVVCLRREDLETGPLEPCNWHLYCYNYNPDNLLAFSNTEEVASVFGRWADNIIPYDLNEILEVVLEEEADGVFYSLEEIDVYKEGNTYQLSQSRIFQRYSNIIYGMR